MTRLGVGKMYAVANIVTLLKITAASSSHGVVLGLRKAHPVHSNIDTTEAVLDPLVLVHTPSTVFKTRRA